MFAALIILALHIPSVHTAMGGAAARAPTRAPGYPIEEGAYSGFLPGLEYRPWRHGDLFGGEQLPMTYGRRFVAAVPNSEYVLGYVESEEDKPAPAYLWDELQGMTERDTVVYISCVIVHSYVQNKRIASTMLPKALDDLQYRPWKPGDMMLRSEMQEVMGGRRFVAFKPEADHVKASLLSIVGYVESQEVSHFLAHMLKLPAKERDTVVYISIVYVVSNERRKGIGEMMLRKALEDVTVNHNPSSTDISTTCHL
ncbi:hypothetical protein FOL46_009929 [Perkinsus olseni]|uniref:N-acetyltransferase domain-containing protein n=1 Tax=Perkinsus olseni TaxID=32597 RepID=A0A7J6KYT0_PEROL|nr:hypothetical protein FOL46_009929 [Perkinsus olseni]